MSLNSANLNRTPRIYRASRGPRRFHVYCEEVIVGNDTQIYIKNFYLGRFSKYLPGGQDNWLLACAMVDAIAYGGASWHNVVRHINNALLTALILIIPIILFTL